MSILAFAPLALFVAIAVVFWIVSLWFDFLDWRDRRAATRAPKPMPRVPFRPVVIEGGKRAAPAALRTRG